MILSAGEDKALEQSRFIKRIIEGFWMVRSLMPPAGSDGIWAADAFDVAGSSIAQAPSVRTKGIFGQLTGGRPTILIPDDIEVPKTSNTSDMRQKLFKATEEFEALLVPGGMCKGLGTPQTEESVYNRLRQERGYQVLIIPIRVPEKINLNNYSGNFSPLVQRLIDREQYGALVDPKRFDAAETLARESAMGRSGFRLQYMLDTTLSDLKRYPLKLNDLIVFDVDKDKAPIDIQWSNDPIRAVKDIANVGLKGDALYRAIRYSDHWESYTRKLMTIDPSGRGADQVGYAVGGALKGYIYLFEYGGIHGGYVEQNLIQLCLIAKKYDVSEIAVEDNFGDGMFSKLLEPYVKRLCPSIGIRSFKTPSNAGHKEKRIVSTLEPITSGHRLIISYNAIVEDMKILQNAEDNAYQYCGLRQYTRMTNERKALAHDDIIEAISMLCEQLSTEIAKETQNNEAAYLKKQWHDNINKWLKESVKFLQKPVKSKVSGALGILRRQNK